MHPVFGELVKDLIYKKGTWCHQLLLIGRVDLSYLSISRGPPTTNHTPRLTVYCTSVEKLIAIPIWEQQRIYRPERAQLLAQDIKAKLQDGKPLTLPGVRKKRRGSDGSCVCVCVCARMHARIHAC